MAIKKSTVYVLVIFLLGLATGGIIGVTFAKQQMMKAVKFKAIARGVQNELIEKLDLDSAQQQKLEPLVDRSMDRIKVIYFDTLTRIDEVLVDAQKELVADLRPEQVAKLSTLAKSRQDFIKKHNPMEAGK